MHRTEFIFGLLVAASVTAMPIPPEPIPVKRLVASLSERIHENPNDVQAVFTLGRVHYFAFAGATDTLNTVQLNRSGPPDLYDRIGERGKGRNVPAATTKAMSESERLAHLKDAVRYLQRAVSMNADQDGLHALGLACAFEDGARFAPKIGALANLAANENAWTDAAIRYYGLAFDRAGAGDLHVKSIPPFGLSSLVGYEAANSYIRLSTKRDARVTRANRFIETMKRLPPGPITPLIFALDRRATLSELLSDRVVDFNLSGSNRPQRYRWVKPDTAILVWDPDGSGRIRSGRQLFGSVTWWMFWDDAYQALRILDDDRNGWIEGHELGGLALWFDRNQNGVSDAGEVIPIEATPVAAIGTHAGLRLKDGRLLPTYDWIATPK